MSRHAMVERDDFHIPGHALEQAESGITSDDVWWDMVCALRDEHGLDLVHLTGTPGIPLSRGRHHYPSYYTHSAPDRDFDRGDWQSLPDGGVFVYANQFTPTVFRRLVTDTHEGYETISSDGRCPAKIFRSMVPRHGR